MKKFINKVKRGFTLVELTIVIAVIAILIAVLVPTFITLIDSANESKDTQMIYNVNLALSIDNSDINTVSDALEVAAEAGYNIDKLTPSSNGEIVYDGVTKSFALISTEGEVIYPTSNSNLDLNAPTTYYFVDEATYTALNTETSASASSYSLAKASIKSATDETANTSTTKEHTVSYIAKGEWTSEFSYTGMGAIDTTRATGITSVSYTSKTVTNNKDYKLNVAYYIGESSADNYSLTVNITESVDTIYTSVASNVIYNISVAENCTVNIVEANENAAPMIRQDTNTGVTLTISINGTDVTEDYVVEKNENAVVENGVLQLGTEKYPWLIASESDLTKVNYGGYCKVSSAEVTSTSALTVASGTEAILDLNGYALTITGTSSNSHIVNNGTLTITDSSTAENGTLVVSTATYGIKNNGTLTVKDGTIKGKQVIYLNSTSASLYMTGGTITATDTSSSLAYGIYANASKEVSVTGGTIEVTYGYAATSTITNLNSGSSAVYVSSANNSSVSISDTIISSIDTGIQLYSSTNTAPTVYINNCKISADNCALYSSKYSAEITDGEYSGHIGIQSINSNNAIKINGGTFTNGYFEMKTGNTLNITGSKLNNVHFQLGNVNNLTLSDCTFTSFTSNNDMSDSSWFDSDLYTQIYNESTYNYTITKNI